MTRWLNNFLVSNSTPVRKSAIHGTPLQMLQFEDRLTPTATVIENLSTMNTVIDSRGSDYTGKAPDASDVSVASISVNDGAVQRSRIDSITVNFSSPIDASLLTGLGAITLTRTAATATGQVGTVLQTGGKVDESRIVLSATAGLVTSIRLTFATSETQKLSESVECGSLADGSWQLAIAAVNFTSTQGDPELRRLFGDINNDGTVDGPTDFAAFGNSMGQTGAGNAFDFNNDGVIDATDYAAFSTRWGVSL